MLQELAQAGAVLAVGSLVVGVGSVGHAQDRHGLARAVGDEGAFLAPLLSGLGAAHEDAHFLLHLVHIHRVPQIGVGEIVVEGVIDLLAPVGPLDELVVAVQQLAVVQQRRAGQGLRHADGQIDAPVIGVVVAPVGLPHLADRHADQGRALETVGLGPVDLPAVLRRLVRVLRALFALQLHQLVDLLVQLLRPGDQLALAHLDAEALDLAGVRRRHYDVTVVRFGDGGTQVPEHVGQQVRVLSQQLVDLFLENRHQANQDDQYQDNLNDSDAFFVLEQIFHFTVYRVPAVICLFLDFHILCQHFLHFLHFLLILLFP